MLFGSVFLAPVVRYDSLHNIFTNFNLFFDLLFIGLISTTLADYLFIYSLKSLSETKASLLTLIEIPFITIVGVFILYEKLFYFQIIGICLFIVGAAIGKNRASL